MSGCLADGDTRELPGCSARRNSSQSLRDARSLRYTDPFAGRSVYFRGALRFLRFSFTKQVVLLKVKYFQHVFLCCPCYCTGSMGPSSGNNSGFSVQWQMPWRHGGGQGRATPLSVGECPARMERGGESNSSQTLYSPTVFLKSFPATGFGAAELDGLGGRWLCPSQGAPRLPMGSGAVGRGPGRACARLSIPLSANCPRPKLVLLWYLQIFLRHLLGPSITPQTFLHLKME